MKQILSITLLKNLVILFTLFSANLVKAQFIEQTGISMPGVYESAVAWGDYDNDGYLDVLLTGNTGSSRVSKIYRNNGNGTFTEQTTISLIGVSDGSVAWGDYNNDGYLDFLLTGYTGTDFISKLYKNNGDGTFTEQSSISLAGIESSSVAWGDFNNDGYLDMLLTGWVKYAAVSKIYKNNGNGTFTEQTNTNLTGVYSCSAAWGDYNNDGYQDILLSGFTNSVFVSKLYKNIGNGKFMEQTDVPLVGVSSNSLAWGDYNNDSYLDILLTGYNGSINLSKIYKSNGNGIFNEQTGISIPNIAASSVAWGDYNNDGYIDMLLTGHDGTSGIAKIFKNNGNGSFTEQTNISLPGVSDGAIAWGDFDNDGNLDILLTGKYNGTGITKLYKNSYAVNNTQPLVPSNLNAKTNQQFVTLTWDKSTDTQTPQIALTYNIKVGKTKNGIEITSPLSNSNGKRQIVADGNAGHGNFYFLTSVPDGKYYWSVQTIDNGFAGSNFSPTDSFTVSTSPPILQAKDINFSSVMAKQITANWTKGDGLQRVVFIKQSNTGTALPANGITYTPNSVFTNGSQIGTSGWYCVYNDTGSYVNVTGLNTEVEYSLMVFEYNGAPCYEKYLTSSSTNNPNTVKTKQTFFTPLPHKFGTAYWQSNLSLMQGDYDHDNRLDILSAEEDRLLNKRYINVYKNIPDSGYRLVSNNIPTPYLISAFWMDYNNDGYLDYADSKCSVFKNNAGNSFNLQSDINTPGYVYFNNSWVDIDGDGDQDLFIDSIFYRNDGNNSFTPVQTGIPHLNYVNNADFGDFDHDGSIDVLYTGATDNNMGKSVVYIYINNHDNTYTKKFEYKDPNYNKYMKAYWEDLDNDGDLDLILTGLMYEGNTSINMRIMENTGNYTFISRFTQPASSWGSSETLSCVDYNNDGYKDILFGSLYKNKGNFEFEKLTDEFIGGGAFGWGDYDNDGDIDYISGYNFYRNNSDKKNVLPSVPDNVNFKVSGNNVILKWNRALDIETPQKGLSYNLSIKNTNNGNFIVNPNADLTTGYRRIVDAGNAFYDTLFVVKNLSPGTYSARVQAIDYVYAGGSFSNERLITIPTIPTIQATTVTISNIADKQVDISWTNGNGEKRAVFVKYNTSKIAYPINNTAYDANSIFGLGTQIEQEGWYCVYNGTGNKVTLSGLSSAHEYRVMVCEYSGNTNNEIYASTTSQGNPVSFKTSGVNAVNILTDNNLNIYPNPAHDYAKIIREQTEPCLLMLISVNGKVMISKPMVYKEELLDLHKLPHGLYILKLQSKEGVFVSKLIVE